MKLEIIKPGIFPANIISGVTTKNIALFPEHGLSFAPANILGNEEVKAHKTALANFLQTDYKNLIFTFQTHSDKILKVDEEYIHSDGDGMFTNLFNKFLVIKIADCAAVLLYDSQHQNIAAVHSGWRGTMQNIVKKAILKLKKNYGTNPKNILAYISPCASFEKYEVEWDVAQYFPDYIKETREGKYLFDNKGQIKNQLLDAGVKPVNIEISDVCTINDTNFHSYRRDKEKSGRMAAFIGMVD